MLRVSTQPETARGQEVQLDVFGRKFGVLLQDDDGSFSVSSSARGLRVFGFSKEHALSNMHFALVCLAHMEAKQKTS